MPLFIHYDPGLSVVLLLECSTRAQALLQYNGEDPQTARLSWTNYPSGKTAWLTESARVACGW